MQLGVAVAPPVLQYGGGGGTGSAWGRYQGVMSSRIQAALSRNNITKTAEGSVIIQIWLDATGRITKASLNGSIGDPAVDAAISEAVVGLDLNELPPDPPKPMPVKMRLTLRKP